MEAEAEAEAERAGAEVAEAEVAEAEVAEAQDTEAQDTEAAAPSAPECVVCMSAPASHAFVPCGHRCVCYECGCVLDECALCRAPAQHLLRVYGLQDAF